MSNKNIVLIGMPGSGKTTIGKMISGRLAREFCDIDEYIEDKHQKSISDIFKDGETAFRNIEMEAVKEVSERTGVIISTGGGVIKFPENIDHLKKGGIIIFIDRSVDSISSDVNINTRPLLKDGLEKLISLHKERYILYKEYADYIVSNERSLEGIVEDIIGLIENHKDGSGELESDSD